MDVPIQRIILTYHGYLFCLNVRNWVENGQAMITRTPELTALAEIVADDSPVDAASAIRSMFAREFPADDPGHSGIA